MSDNDSVPVPKTDKQLVAEAMMIIVGVVDRAEGRYAQSLTLPPQDPGSAFNEWWRAARAAVGDYCGHCGIERSACVGSYDEAVVATACDSCCGHGNEDGACVPLYDEDEVRAPVAVAG